MPVSRNRSSRTCRSKEGGAIVLSGFGTFETCRPALKTSANRGRAEVIGLGSKRRDCAYGKVITSGKITHAELIARTEIFAGEWAKRLGRAPGEKQFIPYPASWLNKGAYDDVSDDAPKPSGPAPIKSRVEFSESDWLVGSRRTLRGNPALSAP